MLKLHVMYDEEKNNLIIKGVEGISQEEYDKLKEQGVSPVFLVEDREFLPENALPNTMNVGGREFALCYPKEQVEKYKKRIKY